MSVASTNDGLAQTGYHHFRICLAALDGTPPLPACSPVLFLLDQTTTPSNKLLVRFSSSANINKQN